ncbi:MAG TPA: protein kinase [Verrucomicrobiae bacterium]|nr:protein kinase [Verrucomicrobiae bacterium]
MTTFQPCERCGAMLPRDSTDGLCPVCLVRLVTGEGESSDAAPRLEEARRSAAPRIGSRVGEYVLEAPLGEGGMGIVYRARQLGLNRVVALKMLPFGRFSPDAHLKRFQAEAEAIARLRHPNIVTIHEVGEHDGQPFFSMEYVDGSDLAKVIRERPLPIREAARLLAGVAKAIQYAHENGIVHRDLKPSNILIGREGEPHVSDFGLARNLASDSDLTMTGQALGSPHYIPPEQAEGRREAHTAASDVYGLGAILYHLLVGRPPFVGETVPAILRQLAEADPVPPRLLNPDVPGDLETICLKCLEKNPARRYWTARKLAEELERFLRDEPIHARPVGPLERGWRWCRRRPAVAGMTAVTSLTLCIGLMASLTLGRREQERARQLSVSLVRVELQRVEDLFERGESPEALAHLARLLRDRPDNRVVAQRTVSALTHRNFLAPASAEFENVHQGRRSALAVTANRIVSATGDGRKLVLWNTSNELARENEWSLAEPAYLAAFDAAGSRLVVVTGDNAVQFWNLAGQPTLLATGKLSIEPATIQFDSKGSLLLAIQPDRGAELMDAGTGVILRQFANVHFAELNADGRWLVTVAGTEATVRDAKTLEPVGSSIRHAYRIESARFSPDSTRLITAAADMSARIWEVPSGRRVGRPLFHQEQLLDAAFSPDGQRVFTVALSAQGQLWDAVSGLPMGRSFPQRRPLDAALFSPDGLWLLSFYQDRVWIRDAFSGEAICEPVRLASSASRVQFLADGRRIVITDPGDGGRARLWSALPGDAPPVLLPHEIELVWAGFSPDGSRILTCSKDRTARIWSATNGAALTGPLRHDRRLTCGVFDSTGARVATGDFDGIARIWNAVSGEPIARPLKHGGDVTGVAFSPDGKWLASAATDGTARIWNSDTGAEGPVLRHQGAVRALAFTPDGNRLATAGDDREVSVWSLPTAALKTTLKHPVGVTCLAFSRDGRRLVSGDQSGNVRIWNVESGTELSPPLQHAGLVNSVRFSGDDRLLVTASSDQTARVWDAATHRPVSPPLRHRDAVSTASFNPDGRYVLTASYDHTVRVWDAATGQTVCDALPHHNRVVSAEWSPDGRAILPASWDGSARLWTLPLLAEIPPARWLADAAETLGGLRMGENEAPIDVSLRDVKALGNALGSSTADGEFREWVRWLVADRQRRGMGPWFEITAQDHVQNRLEDTRPDRLRELLRLTPMNGVALARWSRLVLKQNRERNPRWLAEATYAAELASRLTPDSHEPWWSLAEVKLTAKDGEAAGEAFRRMQGSLPKELSSKDHAELESLRQRLGIDDASR